MRLRLSLCAGVMSAILLLEACVSQRLGQFRNFSQVGVAYVKASDTFFDEAGSAAIRGDNAILLKTRTELTETERRDRILKNDSLLQQRLLILRQIKTHSHLLRDYFEIIGE